MPGRANKVLAGKKASATLTFSRFDALAGSDADRAKLEIFVDGDRTLAKRADDVLVYELKSLVARGLRELAGL